MKITRVAIVEDITEIREGLKLLIDQRNGFECRHTFSSAEDALAEIPTIKPDVVLMDIHLPGMSGIDCIKHLKPLCENTLFIMSTVYEDDDNIFESLKAGASGYLLKKQALIKSSKPLPKWWMAARP